MESSTRTTPRKTKKWSKTEWLLLLAPLLVVGGLALMNFAPQVKQSFRERRDYGNNRPYAVFYAGDDLTYNPIAFSPNGKYLAVSRRGTLSPNNGNHSVETWDIFSTESVVLATDRHRDPARCASATGFLSATPITQHTNEQFFRSTKTTAAVRLLSGESPRQENGGFVV